ncbi:MAG: type 1 glutamine amidotransferase domain-containing protein [Luteimonas sp.]
MPAFRLLISLLFLVLSSWHCGLPKAHAADGVAERAGVARPLTAPPAASVRVDQTAGRGDLAPPVRSDQARILFILASARVHGSSTIPASISFGEVVHAWDTFHAAGYAIDFVTPDGGDVPILDAYVDDEVAPRLEDARIMRGLRNTATPAQIDPDRYRAVYYVGGSNAMYGVPEHSALQRIAAHVYERNGGVISAVCHGTAGIVHIRLANGQYLVSGKRISGYPEDHEDQDAAYFREFPFLIRQTVEARGGSFHMVDSEAPYIEIDGRVVTGQNYASAAPVAETVVDVLRGIAAQSSRADTAQR